jgi:hypothetical protein
VAQRLVWSVIVVLLHPFLGLLSDFAQLLEHEHVGARFPQECQAISKRYALFKRKLGLEKKQEAAKRLRAIALELDSPVYILP